MNSTRITRNFRLITIMTVLCLWATLSQGQDYIWQHSQAKINEKGSLEWAPKAFEFEAGKVVRYIDYESGKDSNPGTKALPWKHHPWDPAAADKCAADRSADTYIFKGGVVYRGTLNGGRSGKKDQPLRLTTDPQWGTGKAIIDGSQAVTSWKQGADQADIPQANKVWYADLNYAPRAVFYSDQDGEWKRLKLARTPNWDLPDDSYDVRKEWWKLQNPEWWKNGKSFWKRTVNAKKMHLGVDAKNLTESADYYEGALVWSEWGIMMGAPYAAPVEKYFPKEKAIAFQGPWHKDSQVFMTNNRYYLEDKPHYLDEAGEFWFKKDGAHNYKNGEGGRLYLRLPNDMDPNTVAVEAARHINLVDLRNVSHLHITNLHFMKGNIFWNLDFRFFQHPDVEGAAVRILGSGKDIRVSNCGFDHVVSAVRIDSEKKGTGLDEVVVADNEINHTDHGAITTSGNGKGSSGRLYSLHILRNKLNDIGGRPLRPNGHFAIKIEYPETAVIAGNILNWTYAAGIDMHGGKSGMKGYEAPLSRFLVFNNQATDTVLGSNDWGGIETWQGGPFYVFNNVSGNALGPMRWTGRTFSHAYYMDGAFKNYLFNNIAWGRDFPNDPWLANVSAFQEIHSYQNSIFNNTAYNFKKGSRRQKAEPGRNLFLGNIWQDISENVFRHSDKEGEDPNAHHAGKQEDAFDHESNAYSHNVFYEIGDVLATFEAEGGDYRKIEELRKAMSARKTLASDVGIMAKAAPLRDAKQHDFRLNPDSEAVDYGVKAFVPWSLYATVGEWNFFENQSDPSHVQSDAWYLTAYHHSRENFETRPSYPLTGQNIGAESFVEGPLEDWTDGALKLNGQDQYLSISQQLLAKPYSPTKDEKVSGEQLKNPQVYTSSFIIEATLKPENGASGILVEKIEKTGYSLIINESGQPVLTVASPDGKQSITGNAKLNDGKWHHLLAEADRAAGKLRLYVDGKLIAEGDGPDTSVSLANESDFFVGGRPGDKHLAMTVDFMRFTLGSLADSKTTIDELYTWQANGPFLRDFTGQAPTGGKRDAGALELR